jgi:uncharacterized protein YcfJ
MEIAGTCSQAIKGTVLGNWHGEEGREACDRITESKRGTRAGEKKRRKKRRKIAGTCSQAIKGTVLGNWHGEEGREACDRITESKRGTRAGEKKEERNGVKP